MCKMCGTGVAVLIICSCMFKDVGHACICDVFNDGCCWETCIRELVF